jgi:hypothetical protein
MAKLTRHDGWNNLVTALGKRGRDKRLSTEFELATISQEQAEDLWRGDDMAARAIETVPMKCFVRVSR